MKYNMINCNQPVKDLYVLGTVMAVAMFFCIGCGGKLTQEKHVPITDTSKAHAISGKLVKLELKKSKKEYRKQFGRKVSIYCDRYRSTENILFVLKHALKNNRPFPNHRMYVMTDDILIARYELQFNRKIPDCQYADDACKDNPQLGFGKIDTTNCQCRIYLLYLLDRALYDTNEPLPEKVIVTKLDLWKGIYRRFTGKESFPLWFDESSYEDKVIYLKEAIGTGMPWYGSYLSRKQEDDIKTKLEEAAAEKEFELGREMTDLEKTITEFEIQFGQQIPKCECTDEELLIYLKHHIKYNSWWYTPSKPITKDEVRYIVDGRWWDDLKKRYK